MARIYLSPPDLAGTELELLRDAVASNWIAPLGPHVDAFEAETAARLDVPHALACSSGTAALHLALEVLGIGAGDEVWLSTLTFAATANAVAYVRATPVFIDSDRATWNMDPALLAEALDQAARAGKLPKAVIVVDLYGQCAELEPIVAACRRHGVVVIEDAAEALERDVPAAGRLALGDMSSVVQQQQDHRPLAAAWCSVIANWIDRARLFATQARSPAPASTKRSASTTGCRTCSRLRPGAASRRSRSARRGHGARPTSRTGARSGELAGWQFMPEAPGHRATFWLTCATLDAPADRDRVIDRLAAADIEARPVWKPMHMQPVFAGCRAIGGGVAEQLFAQGICLPSGSNLTDEQRERVVREIIEAT